MNARRRLTADERDRNDEQEQAFYDEQYAEIEAQDREEHDREFGAGVPFNARTASIHQRVLQRIADAMAERDEP